MLRLDIESVHDESFFGDVTLRSWPELKVGIGSFAGMRERRTRELAADGNNDLCLLVSLFGRFTASQCGRDFIIDQGDAFFASQGEPASYLRPSLGKVIGAIVPRAALTQLIPDIDDKIGRKISHATNALKICASYLVAIAAPDDSASPELTYTVATHVHDLVALSIGATGDAAEIASERGLRAARFSAIKADIAKNVARHELSAEWMAPHHGISPSSVRRLFEQEGTTFSLFVLDRRLAQAYRRLRDPRFSDRTISSIAFSLGFGDLSYFNRTFRRQFGASPSDVRAAARQGYDA